MVFAVFRRKVGPTMVFSYQGFETLKISLIRTTYDLLVHALDIALPCELAASHHSASDYQVVANPVLEKYNEKKV